MILRSVVATSLLVALLVVPGCKGDKDKESATAKPAADPAASKADSKAKPATPAKPAATAPADKAAGADKTSGADKAAAGADGSRLDPDGDKNPEAVSQRLILKISEAKWPISRFINPSRGVVSVVWKTGGGADDAKEIKTAKLLCGADLKKVEKKYPALLKERFADQSEMIECENKPMRKCTVGSVAEYSLEYDFVFDKDDEKGVFLIGIVAMERATMGDEWLDKGDVFAKKKIAELSSKGCK